MRFDPVSTQVQGDEIDGIFFFKQERLFLTRTTLAMPSQTYQSYAQKKNHKSIAEGM